MLRKFFMTLTVFFIIAASEICFAELALVRLTLGGITIGTEFDWVKNTYGAPSRISRTSSFGDACHEYYDQNFRVIYKRDRVVQVICGGRSDFRTFDGVKIGDPISVLTAVYGEPDEYCTPPYKIRRTARSDSYFCYNSTSTPYQLLFLAKSGKIVLIMSGIIEDT